MSQYLNEEEILKYCNRVPAVQVSDVIIASNLIDGYLGFSFSEADTVETVRLNEKRRGRLKHYPVIEVKSIKEVYASPVGLAKSDGNTEQFYQDVENDGYFYYYPKVSPFRMPMDFCAPFIPRLSLEISYKYG